MSKLAKKITAPAALTAGRLFGLLTSAKFILTLLLAASHLPRECFNENGMPKIRHKSREAAVAHKRALLLESGQPWHSLKVYVCGRCGFWHVGHTGRRRRRGAR